MLKILMAKRMRIIDNEGVLERIGRANTKEVLLIFKELKEQIQKNRAILEKDVPKGALEKLMPSLNKQIEFIGKMENLKREHQNLGFTLRTQKKGITQSILSAANEINGLLLEHHFGGESPRFSQLFTSVRKDYLNPQFPESMKDFDEIITRKVFPGLG